MNYPLIIAIIVVVIILIAFAYSAPDWAPLSYWLAHYIEKPWKIYSRSGGTFDDAAALALERTLIRTNRTPQDDILCATIITRNILAQEDRQMQQADLRYDMFNAAHEHFINALRQPDPHVMNAVFEFAFDGFATLVNNEPLLAGATFPFITIRHGPNGQIFAVDHPLATVAAERHQELIRQNAADAAASADTPAGVVDAYVDLAVQHTVDPQNVHDPSVLACLKAIIERLRADQGDEELPSIDDIKLEIQVFADGRKQRVIDVNAVIDATTRGERVIAIGATDKECLQRVWLRSTDSRNADVRNKIRTAVFDALYDCWEEGIMGRAIVCVNGRTSRILATLVLLDWDTKNWEIKRLEQFKNEIFNETKKVIIHEAQLAAAQDTDIELQKAGKRYLATTNAELATIGEISDAADAALITQMHAAIDLMIQKTIQDLPKDAIPTYMIPIISNEAKAAVQ
jgi:hypothetical protein